MAEKKTAKTKPKKPQKKRLTDKAHRFTNTGHRLTIQESKFIDKYIELGNGAQAVRDAGYKCKVPETYANGLLRKSYIAEEIKYRTDSMSKSTIATAQEVMEYFTKVMNGEIKDQFNLEAPLSERTKAAQELAKRTVDIENRLAGKEDARVRIEIDWKRNR